jgi:hypothetical protein
VGTLTMRMRWYAAPSLVPLCGFALCSVLGFFSHGAFGVAAIFAVGWVIAKFSTKIEVTSTDVGLSIWLLRRKSAPRDEIAAVHWYGRSFTFVDDSQRVLLGIPSLGWTRSQLLELSETLGVRLYSHRTRGGLGKDSGRGRLIRRLGLRESAQEREADEGEVQRP